MDDNKRMRSTSHSTHWQDPPVFIIDTLLEIMGWQSQWFLLERVCHSWLKMCMHCGGCRYADVPPRFALHVDERLQQFQRHHTQIQSLRLCLSKINDIGLSILSSYQNLTTLDLTCCRHITDSGLEQISQLPLLTTLRLRHCRNLFKREDTASLSHLANLSTLTQLDIATNPQMISSHWQQLSTLRFVHTLDVSSSHHLTDDSIYTLSTMTQLRSLNLGLTHGLVGTPGLNHLSALHQLQFLVLTACRNLTDLSALSDLSALVSLDLSICEAITDNQFRYLSPLPYLETLSLAGCTSLSIETLRFVTTLPSLTQLDITRCTFSIGTSIACSLRCADLC